MAASNPTNGDTIEKSATIDFNEPLKMTRTKTIPIEESSASRRLASTHPFTEKSVDQPVGPDKGKKGAVKEKTLDIVSKQATC